jgi:hypothetical protein
VSQILRHNCVSFLPSALTKITAAHVEEVNIKISQYMQSWMDIVTQPTTFSAV